MANYRFAIFQKNSIFLGFYNFCMNFNEIWKFSGICFTSVLIKISMNLFDQLVIVIDDPDMEG